MRIGLLITAEFYSIWIIVFCGNRSKEQTASPLPPAECVLLTDNIINY